MIVSEPCTVEIGNQRTQIKSIRFWVMFALLIVLYCYPLWRFPYFPSQDGPAHLHNAAVVASYNREPIYQKYYHCRLTPAGHILTEVLMILLLKAVAPLLAEKLILTLYVVLLPLSLRYFLAGFTRYANQFCLFGFLFVPNFFLYMGFFNFYASISLMLFGLGYCLRHRQQWHIRSAAGFAALSALTYAAHLLSWAILAGTTALLIVADVWRLQGKWPLRRAILRSGLPLAGLLVPGMLFLAYIGPRQRMYAGPRQTDALAIVPMSLRVRAWDFYGISFLRTIAPEDLSIATTIAAMAALLTLLAATGRLRNCRLKPSDACLLLSAALAALLVVRPAGAIWAYYLPERVSLYAWLFLIGWLAAQDWPRLVLPINSALICVLAVLGLSSRLLAHQMWNDRLEEFASVGQCIQPQSTVLAVHVGLGPAPTIDPLVHAGGIFAPKAYVDLANFEPITDHFITTFRPERSPFNSLGTLIQLNAIPPVFDIQRYERSTQGRVDYLVFYGGLGNKPPELEQFSSQLAAYQLVYSSRRAGRARLYRRRGY
jgi:hypothetical protein